MSEASRQEIQDLGDMLTFQREVGIDCALSEVAENWFDRPAISTQVTPTPGKISQQRAVPPSPVAARPAIAEPNEALSQAGQIARDAENLETLKMALENFNGCTLKQSANRLVFADGNPEADIMLIGEAPGRDEDIQGLPFVGRSGQLLDRILASIGLDRTTVYIANTVPWRPPGNRTPSPMETQICRPFIERQVELVSPKIVVTLGGAAAKQVLNVSTGILRLRGQVSDLTMGKHTSKCLPTLHPAYLLRQPAQKQLVWQDMQKLREMIDTL